MKPTLTFCTLEHQIVVGSCGPVYKDFFLDSGLLGTSVRAPLLISGFPLYFETRGKSALFSYFCTPNIKQYTLFNFRGTRQIGGGRVGGVKIPLQRVNGNAEYNSGDATVATFSNVLGTIWVTSLILRTFQYFSKLSVIP